MRTIWILVLFLIFPVISSGQQVVILEWDPPLTNADGTTLTDLDSYRLYMDFIPIRDDRRDATLVATIPQGTVTASVTLPSAGAQVFFRVSAVDVGGNESTLSNEVSLDTLAPASPALLRFLIGLNELILEIIPPSQP